MIFLDQKRFLPFLSYTVFIIFYLAPIPINDKQIMLTGFSSVKCLLLDVDIVLIRLLCGVLQ